MASKIERQCLTPAIAREMLKNNAHTYSRAVRGRGFRPVCRKNVDEMKAIWLRGDELSGFASTWILLVNNFVWNGQHRLTAISEMPDEFRINLWVINATADIRKVGSGATWDADWDWDTAIGVVARFEAERRGISLHEIIRELEEEKREKKNEQREARESYSRSLQRRLQP